MAGIVYYVDIDQQKNSIYNYKQHPITTAYMAVSASVLGVNDKGFAVFNTDNNLPYWWDGTQFRSFISGSDINTGSLLTTSSFNNFTSSYNTGSFLGGFTGSLLGSSSYSISSSQSNNSISSSYSLSSSYAVTSSFYNETDPLFSSKSSSLATTGSNTFQGDQTVSGSLILTDSLLIESNGTSSIYSNGAIELNDLQGSLGGSGYMALIADETNSEIGFRFNIYNTINNELNFRLHPDYFSSQQLNTNIFIYIPFKPTGSYILATLDDIPPIPTLQEILNNNHNLINNVNFQGTDAGSGSFGGDINAFGVDAAKNNSGSFINAFGNSAGKGNSGNDVNAFGTNAGENNTFQHVNLIGSFTSADDNSQTVFQNDSGSNARISYKMLTSDRKYILPDKNITFAGLDDIPSLNFTSSYTITSSFNSFTSSYTTDSSSFNSRINTYDPFQPASFVGTFGLDKKGGNFYPDLVQTGSLTLVTGSSSIVGGSDCVKITSNGSAISVPGYWFNIGGDSISTISGSVNRIMVLRVASEVWYSVKVN